MNEWFMFALDTNSAFGQASTRREWVDLKNKWLAGNPGSTAEYLKSCKSLPPEMQKRRIWPKFGFVVECAGPDTLGAFFKRNGMEW